MIPVKKSEKNISHRAWTVAIVILFMLVFSIHYQRHYFLYKSMEMPTKDQLTNKPAETKHFVLKPLKIIVFNISYNWKETVLVNRLKAVVDSAQKQLVDLRIAWHEWQIAQIEKMAAYHLFLSRKHLNLSLKHRALLIKIVRQLEENRVRLQHRGDNSFLKKIKWFANMSVKNIFENRLKSLEQQIKQQRFNQTMELNLQKTSDHNKTS
jgi:NADH:ubiquinone oxidoreductase subunit 5 (subunit L)/multisubunit Na+/H+ antiporter MnhA subunit